MPGAVATLFLACSIFYSLHSATLYEILRLWGLHQPVEAPFLDLQYLAAVTECWEKGVNVYVFDPCDQLGRLFGYSPLWLRTGFLWDQRWIDATAIAIDLLFILSLAALPPPEDRAERLIMFCAAISPPVVFALQRANIDLLIFMMVLCVAHLWVRGFSQRIVAYAIVFLAGLLKFYPLVLLGLVIRERAKSVVIIFASGGIALLVFAQYFYGELVQMVPNIPRGTYFISDMFGARNLPDGVSYVLGYRERFGWPEAVLWLVLATLVLAEVTNLFRWVGLRRALVALPPVDRALLICGAAITAGCFFAGQSVGYREIFLLFCAPGTLALQRMRVAPAVRRFGMQMTALILFELWQGVLTWNSTFFETVKLWFGPEFGTALWSALWIGRELTWWFIAAALTGILFCSFFGSALNSERTSEPV